MPPKKVASKAAPKTKAPAKVATKPAPKKAASAAGKAKVAESSITPAGTSSVGGKKTVDDKITPVVGTKRKSSDDDEEEVVEEQPKSKKAKSAAPAKAPAAKKTSGPTKVPAKVAEKKPAPESAVKPVVEKPAPKPAAKKAASATTTTKATTTKAAPKKAVVPTKSTTTKAAPKKATSVAPSTKSAAPKVNGTKRKAESEPDEAPATKKAKGRTLTLNRAPTTAATKKVNGVAKKNTTAAKAKPAPKAKAAPKPKVDAEAKDAAKKVADEKKAAAKKVTDEKRAAAKIVAEEKRVAAQKSADEKKKEKALAALKKLPIINQPKTTKLDIYVFGENSAGELGLGVGKDPNGKSVVDVKRPRINHNLFADKVGVVDMAVGGMHCVALTHDNKIYTWGVNDQGALGRSTDAGPMRDISEDKDDEDSDSDEDAGEGLNASEATPFEVDAKHFPEGTKFARVFAGDSISFALTTTGLVYGWGTFRGNDGILGFRINDKDKQANTPELIPELKDVVDIACGTNHVLALTNKGKVFTWGAGEQNQLARRVLARSLKNGLVPREFGLGKKKIVKVGAGDYHSFVVDDKGTKYAWGLNTFGQTGVEKDSVDDDYVMTPKEIINLKGYDIKQIVGGAHHSMACTEDGKVLVWGRCDNKEAGVALADLPKDKVFFQDEKPKYLEKPLELEEIEGVMVATAGDTCLAVDKEGVAWSWGFNENYQTGQGAADDIEEATEIENTAVKGKKIVFGGLGGQFGVLAGKP
ncbi:related to RCC1 domain [Phialocephala subalpina]|uniref:Related to RCC1 domain n=1 Tax=Phialocephala subalpina TaxID=576137 RepID=A0A1L7XSB2_9HELO|nr:related to RCC1 domain [Phialocephala subalpina]